MPRSDCDYKHRPSKKRLEKQLRQLNAQTKRKEASNGFLEKKLAEESSDQTVPIMEPGFSLEDMGEPLQEGNLPTSKKDIRNHFREKRGLAPV